MSKKISGVITASSSKIYSEQLAVNLCYVNSKGLREKAKIISSKVFKNFSYIIEYEPKELDLEQDYFVEVSYADLRFNSEIVDLSNVKTSEVIVDIRLTDLIFTVEITGSIISSRGVPCHGIPVKCNKYSVSSRVRVILGETVTDANGRYVITLEQSLEENLIDVATSDAIPKFKTDLDIQIIAGDPNQPPVIYSEIYYDVKSKIEHDFVWGDEPYMGLSTIAKQKNIFEKIPSLTELAKVNNQTIPMNQIEYISNKMGVSVNEATHLVNAKNMSTQFDCDEEILFALLDGNANADYTSILFKTDEALLKKVHNAIDNNTIYVPKTGIDTQLSALKEGMIAEYIQEPNFVSKYVTIGINGNNEKKSIVTGTIEWMNNPELQYSCVTINDYLLGEGILTEPQYNKAVLYDGITAVSEWNTELAEKILTTKNGWTKIEDVIAGKGQILGIINGNNVSIPESFATAEEYVEHIDRMLEQEYPSQYLKYEISNNNVACFQNSTVKAFLNSNPDFQFGENHALVTIAKGGMQLNGINIETLQTELQKAEQLFQLTPLENKSEIIDILWSLDLTSAHQIASYTEAAFHELMTEKISGNSRTSTGDIGGIYNKSVSITTQTGLLMHELGLLSPPPPTPVIPGNNYTGGNEENGGLPTIKDLFGSQDYFRYPDSRTMLSPAAYLMDLLQFLEKSTNGETKLETLFERRPDIKNILLNCSNTDNVMPHIDLVNEILEITVSGISGKNLEDMLKELQTNWETKDLIAYPENSSLNYIKSVYNTNLKNTKTPWTLPFYFYLEEYRSYLKQMSLSREDFIKYFTMKNAPEASTTEARCLYEFLGLNLNDVEVITTQKTGVALTAALQEYYNNKIPTGNVHELIGLSGLSYDEIKDLVTSYYINPGNEEDRYVVYTKPGKDNNNQVKPGTLEGTFIMKTKVGASNPSPDETFYDRLHRFERLRKKLNLKTHELDLIIRYLGINLSNANHILQIANVLKIKEQLKLKLEETLLLVGNFKFGAYPAYIHLYDYLFLRKTENYSLKKDFEDLKTKTTGFSPNFKYNEISTILPYISGIKISEDAYNVILDGENISKTGTPAIGGLSQIFRASYLCKSLNITEKEYYFLKQASGLLTLTEPGDLLKFINYVHQIRVYGFSIADLAYIMSDKKLKGTTIALDDEKIIEQLCELQKDLKNLMQEEVQLYRKHISDNLQKEIKPTIDEAMKYIFSDFNASAPNSPDRAKITTFISKHPDLFCRFQEPSSAGTGKTLQEFFLDNGTNPEKKLRAILVGMQLESELAIPDPETSKGKYYSEEDMQDIFAHVKSHVAMEIINGTRDFDIILKDSFLDASRAVEYDPDAVIEKIDSFNKDLTEAQTMQNIKGRKKTKAQSKYAEFTDGNRVKLNINVANFIANNEAVFPVGTDFLEEADNNSRIAGNADNYKNYVFEKNIAVPDEKVTDLRRNLSKFLDETDLDIALDIILKPEKVFAENNTNNKICDFISEKFNTFMPVSEAIGKLYNFESSPSNNGNPSISFVESKYISNYCDRTDLVLKYLKHDQLVDAVVTNLMNLCNAEEEYMRNFLFNYFSYNTSNNTAFSASTGVAAIYGFLSDDFIKVKINANDHALFIKLCRQMYKTAQCVNTFKIPQNMLDSIFEILYGKGVEYTKFEILNIFELSSQVSGHLKKYLNLATAIGLSHTYFTEENNFFKFFHKNGLTKNLSYISKITGCKGTDLSVLNSNVLPVTKLYIDWFQHLLECQWTISYLGVTAQTIIELHKVNDNDITDKHVEKLRQIVKNKYSESEWDKISAELRDPLRMKQRDALRDYLISKNTNNFTSSNELFHHYLIDTEMIPMAKTSRLIQATLSVQLFIQRILMGMEGELSFNPTEKDELIWRKNYRVWEANRKIFFFPENWLDPELRHDKTEIFKSIEEKLLQNDIDDNTVLQAYYDYVEKLEEVSNLEILAAYRPYSINETQKKNFIAFVGRTQGSPHKFFYRTLDLTGIWTPWEEITNGIKADMVRLVYWKGSMYMFWPEVYNTSEIPKERRKDHKFIKKTGDDFESVDDIYFNRDGIYTAIRMAWSRYKKGKWSKAVFCDEVYVEPCNDGRTTNIHFHIIAYSNVINIVPYFIRNKLDAINNTAEDKRICCRASFHFNGAKLYLKYPTEGESHTAWWPFRLVHQHIMIAKFGNNEIINSKAICNENHVNTDFEIIYHPNGVSTVSGNNLEEELNELKLNARTLPIFKKTQSNTKIKYNILYEELCHWHKNWQLDTPNVANYIKPLVLEDQYNGKRFLGIPYKKSKKKDIQIINNNIANLGYLFINFYHPYIEEVKENLQKGYSKLFDSEFQNNLSKPLQINGNTFDENYGVADEVIVNSTPYVEELSFGNIKVRLTALQGVLEFEEATYPPAHYALPIDHQDDLPPCRGSSTTNNALDIRNIEDPYAIYNWEMFYHIPMLIADNLSRNMRFEEAQKWYHLIFDPTLTSDTDKGAKKYWKIKPFRDLFKGDGTLWVPSNIQGFIDDVNLKRGKYTNQIEQWEANPFNPHLVARTRRLSYMQYVVRKYLENIIAWADMYFTKDTREDINQAALLYILAADILGVRPQKLEGTLSADQSYTQLSGKNPDMLSNVYVTIIGILTVMADHFEEKGGKIVGVAPATYKVSYFGAPHNDKMEECWDIVADRLFKIRHCMNIQGVVRELPLTSPPIDPGAIAAAMAAGADLSTALSTLSAPLPLYRFSYMLQKAIEFTNDVKALGNSLLSVLEKCDAEELAILRSTHERAILNAMTVIREKAIEETTKNIEALENSKIAVVTRKDYYKNKKKISAAEQKALDLHKHADNLHLSASGFSTTASILGLLPQFQVPLLPKIEFGGTHLAAAFNALASIQSAIALSMQGKARETDTVASYERRYEDWVFQGDQADKELKQIDKQIAASQVRLAMAERELENHVKQMELKMEEFEFMKEKFTNKQLYNWMKGQVSKLYQQAYQMAHKLALAAEKAFGFEKQREGYNSFITPAYWDNLKEGLMSGELLYQDLRRLEMEYMETNERDIELTKDISLAMIAPEALNELRTKGSCSFEIPEMLYDIDHPGHYMRRIKSVSISIPAVTGPYSGVTCKLSMLNNRFRKSITVGNDGYAYKGMDDTRFIHNIIGIKSIATSSGNNDSGMFEFNFKDERYLPFEGSGAIGRWSIEMPDKVRKFNYATIADVVLHVKYTAKDAGGMLKKDAIDNITESLNYLMDEVQKSKEYLVLAHSLKSEFADAFHKLCEKQPCSLTIEKKHLPFMIVDYVARNSGKRIIIEDILFAPEHICSNYTNKGMELTDAGIIIEPTPSNNNTLSEQEDAYMIIQFRIE